MRLERFLAVSLALVASVPFAQDLGPERGAELLRPFKQDLQQALLRGLEDGPIEAIGACRIRAPEVAAALSQGGTKLGRTSDRLRNPANSSPDWVKPILSYYLDNDTQRMPQSVVLSDDRHGYVEPIVLKPMCEICHGANLAPQVAARIAELYPGDRAVDFVAGELRGVFWIEYPSVE